MKIIEFQFPKKTFDKQYVFVLFIKGFYKFFPNAGS